MTGKVLDQTSTGILVLILPLALVMVVLFTAWPYILLLIALIIAWRIWRNYQWQKWSAQVNPFFQELIEEQRGCITPVDLSLKANLSGRAAQRFLEKKAEEFGAQRKVYGDKGSVYYFLTTQALGNIFADSDSFTEEEEPIESPSEIISNQLSPQSTKSAARAKTATELIEATKEDKSKKEEPVSISQLLKESKKSQQPTVEQKTAHLKNQPINQAELAKRLDLNPSTVGRHKGDEDFPQWSQSKDPEGIAWRYLPETKMFIPLD